MARRYTKEQVAHMMVLSDDESDIDNINDQTIFDYEGDTDTDEEQPELTPHCPLPRVSFLSPKPAPLTQTSLLLPNPVPSPEVSPLPNPASLTQTSPLFPNHVPFSSASPLPMNDLPLTLVAPLDWELIDTDSDLTLPKFTFLGVPGLASDGEEEMLSVNDDRDLIQKSLKLFLTEQLFNDLVEFTNIRADQYLREEEEHLKPHSRFRKWKETDVTEMKRFIGMILLMGVIKKPSLSEYWSTDPFISTPFFQSDFSINRDRFLLLHHFIRFADYRDLGDQHDLLRKIRPFARRIRSIISSVYRPKSNLTVDESLLLFKGRLVFKQYIPAKRSRFGIKIYMLCESDTGYMLNFDFHSMKTEHDRFAQYATALSLSERMVVHLSEEYLDLGYRIFADNWFASVRLASYLLSRRTHFTGTIRPNRGVPQDLANSFTADKETKFATNGNLIVSKFCDKKSSGVKTVYMIDTFNKATLHSTERIVRGGERISVRKSASMVDYNMSMGGVDRADQNLHSYDATRKSYRWFLKVGVHLIQRLCLNAFIIYRNYGGKLSLEQYLICASKFLTGAESLNSTFHLGKRTGQHFPSKIEPRGNNQCPTKRCRVCYIAMEKVSALPTFASSALEIQVYVPLLASNNFIVDD